jgi:hypothetical protein
VTLVAHALPGDPDFAGPITLRAGSSVLSLKQSFTATIAWTSPPLKKGAHTFTIEYSDACTELSSLDITIDVDSPGPQRRAAGR